MAASKSMSKSNTSCIESKRLGAYQQDLIKVLTTSIELERALFVDGLLCRLRFPARAFWSE